MRLTWGQDCDVFLIMTSKSTNTKSTCFLLPKLLQPLQMLEERLLSKSQGQPTTSFEEKQHRVLYYAGSVKAFSFFFLVGFCPSSHPYSVNMGRVCCQSQLSTSKVRNFYLRTKTFSIVSYF